MRRSPPAALALFALALVLSSPGLAHNPPPVEGEGGMVVTAHPLASEVGAAVLAGGGNAADAAVAVGFALAVVLPRAGNLGGGGFALFAPGDGGPVEALDFRETAPAAATETMYLDERGEVVPDRSLLGWLAVGVPGTVRGLAELHARHGSLPWKDLLAPAIRLAAEGFPVDRQLAGSLERAAADLAADAAARAVFLDAEGRPPARGATLVQTDLARTLALLAADPGAFYEGPLAGLLADAMATGGGLVTRADLAAYRAVWREPIHVVHAGHNVYSMPPPSSGGICLALLLRVAAASGVADLPPGSSALYHLMIEAERHVYADRSRHLGDPAFHEVPTRWLLSDGRRDAIVGAIDRDRARPSAEVAPGRLPGEESEETTHFSIVDAAGAAVSCTTTLNGSFGARVMAPGTGFLLNNEMDDFSARPGAPNLYGLIGGEANRIEPGKRMLSSMSPTIVREGGRNVLVLGTPGGSTIITTVFQILVSVLDHDLPLADAVPLRRIHHQWSPDRVDLERGEIYGEDVLEGLRRRGHELRLRSPIGNVQAIAIDRATGLRSGVSDARGIGRAIAGTRKTGPGG